MKVVVKKHIFTTIIFLLSSSTNIYLKSETAKTQDTIPFKDKDHYVFPKNSTIQAITLNYTTVAASLTWIGALTYFGEWRLSKHKHPPEHLLNYANAITILDPSFYSIYPWINATFINAHLEHQGISHENLVALATFTAKGQKHFPNNHELPYLAGLSFIGYSKNRTREERLKEYNLALEYFNACLQIPSCPPSTLLMADQMRRKAKTLKGEEQTVQLNDKEKKRYLDFYRMNQDPRLEPIFRKLLKNTNITPQELDSTIRMSFQTRYTDSISYVNPGLWALLTPNTPEDLYGHQQ